jgi:3-phenylpropionate/trans-cinnamate dioxygenase ferredoxin component
MSPQPIDVAALDALAPGESMRVEVGDTPVCLVRVGDEVFALHDVCSHALESLTGGWIEDECIDCPRHGARFSLRTGEPLTPPATAPVPTFPVSVRDGRILVEPIPSHPHPILS